MGEDGLDGLFRQVGGQALARTGTAATSVTVYQSTSPLGFGVFPENVDFYRCNRRMREQFYWQTHKHNHSMPNGWVEDQLAA